MDEKSKCQLEHLSKLEQEITQHLVHGFVNVGLSLEIIRRDKLYKATHVKWEDYYKDTFALSTPSAYRFIDGARVYKNLEKNQPNFGYKLPLYESQVRPLTKIKNEVIEAECYNESFLLNDKRIPPANIISRVVSERMGKIAESEIGIEEESVSNNLISLSQIKKKYSVILADPPWSYDFGSKKSVDPNTHYNTLGLLELIDIGIQHIANPNCLFFMWCTSPKLDEGLNLIRKLGFTQVSAITWIKEEPSNIGYWVKSAPEHLIISYQGSIKPPDFDKRANGHVFEVPTIHSAKPDIFYKIIEDLSCGFSDRIELFARKTIDGWDSYGDEIGYHQCNRNNSNYSMSINTDNIERKTL